jgi:hypothetical protein
VKDGDEHVPTISAHPGKGMQGALAQPSSASRIRPLTIKADRPPAEAMCRNQCGATGEGQRYDEQGG